jgi:hypothetical protein
MKEHESKYSGCEQEEAICKGKEKGKWSYTKLCSKFPSHFQKQSEDDSFKILTRTLETELIEKVNNIILQAATSLF